MSYATPKQNRRRSFYPQKNDYLHLSIKDDGHGFSPEREKGLGCSVWASASNA